MYNAIDNISLRIKQMEKENSIIKFELTKNNKGLFYFSIFNSKEFEYKENMYDIVKIEELSNNKKIIYALADKYEDQLIESCNIAFNTLFKNNINSDRKKSNLHLLDYIFLCFAVFSEYSSYHFPKAIFLGNHILFPKDRIQISYINFDIFQPPED